MFKFWYKWLIVVSYYFIFMSVLMFFFYDTEIFDFINNQIANKLFSNANEYQSALELIKFFVKIMSSLMLAWMVIILFVLKNAFIKKQKWSWYAIAISYLVWYLIDTLASAYCGIYFNVAGNTVFFVLVLIPLVFTKKYFISNKV
jgi:hypothetical protein